MKRNMLHRLVAMAAAETKLIWPDSTYARHVS